MPRVTYADRLAALAAKPLSNYDRGFVEQIERGSRGRGMILFQDIRFNTKETYTKIAKQSHSLSYRGCSFLFIFHGLVYFTHTSYLP